MIERQLLLSTKVNRLFSTFHARTEPEQSSAVVARAVSTALGRIVPASHIDDLRSARFDTDLSSADLDVLSALAVHFRVPAVYLTENGENAAAIDVDLKFLASARSAGVRSIALRGSGVDNSALAQELERLAETLPDAK